ncbi:MAG: serine/threonine protein kinase [Chloroflexi bacterium]|nr:serine/threonine protein kinase [Chloroflexota bacterium]
MSFIPGANVGPYRIVEQAERNGVATTYTAYQPTKGRYVSVIVVSTIDQDDVPLQRQYQRQIELVLSLRHPNILTVIDRGEHMGVSFIVTELVESEPLADRLGAPWPLAEVVRILKPIATALDFAHGYGVVHGDLQPAMVMLTPDGTPILSGFGLSTRRFSEADGEPTALQPGQRTPSISAETVRAQAADRRGLALIAFEMLTGRAMQVESADFGRPLPPAQLGSPLLTPPVERVLLRELTRERAERYPDSTSFIDDLAAAASSVPAVPMPAPVPEPPLAAVAGGATGGSRRRLLTVAAIFLVLGVLGALALLLRGGDTSGPVAATRPGEGGATAVVPSAASTSAAGVQPGAGATGSAGATGASGGASAPSAGPNGKPAASAVGSGASGGPAGGATAGTAPGATGSSPGAGGSEPVATRPSQMQVVVPTPDVVPTPPPLSSTRPGQPGASSALPGPGAGTPVPGAPSGGAAAAGPASKPAAATPAPTRIPANWRILGDASGRWAFDDQGRIVGRTDEGASLLLFPETVEDVSFSAQVNTTSCQATLVFRVQDDENLLMAIYIPDGIPAPGSTGGGIWLYQRVEGLDVPIRAVRPSTMKQAGESVRLKVATNGPQITVSLDDEPAVQAMDTAARPGKLGLMIYSASGRQCDATFGDIRR